MKINKLLFFLLALVSLNSCVEYVDNGTKPDGPETPEEQKYTAEQANPDVAKYVGDKFVFKAMLNNVDVTSTSKFKVNGTVVSGNSYTPHKTGSHSVVATMDNFEATFKFTVLEKEEEPEPTGNRIEYGGKSYPVSMTIWTLLTDGANPYTHTINGVDYGVWGMISLELDSTGDDILHGFETTVAVPLNAGKAVLPYADQTGMIYLDEGTVYINGAEVFDITSASYNFAATGNTPPVQQGQNFVGDANYTGLGNGVNSGESAELYWTGQYYLSTQDINGPKAKATKKFNKANLISNKQILKLIKK